MELRRLAGLVESLSAQLDWRVKTMCVEGADGGVPYYTITTISTQINVMDYTDPPGPRSFSQSLTTV